MNNTDVVIKLDYPFTFEAEEITELILSRPKVVDQLVADEAGGSNANKEIQLFATLTQQPPAVIEQIDLKDFAKIQKTYSDFLV